MIRRLVSIARAFLAGYRAAVEERARREATWRAIAHALDVDAEVRRLRREDFERRRCS